MFLVPIGAAHCGGHVGDPRLVGRFAGGEFVVVLSLSPVCVSLARGPLPSALASGRWPWAELRDRAGPVAE
jgi:hypothetical protein